LPAATTGRSFCKSHLQGPLEICLRYPPIYLKQYIWQNEKSYKVFSLTDWQQCNHPSHYKKANKYLNIKEQKLERGFLDSFSS
jgi:hypothetical protein